MEFSDLSRRMLGTPPRQASSTRYRQRLPMPLDVMVRGRDAPDGVPLEAILAAAKEASSTVEGLAVRGGEVTVTHSAEPDADQRDRLDRLFGDRERLRALGPPAVRGALTAGELRTALLDEKTPDAEWLKAFRRWAVGELLTHEQDR